MAHANLVFWAMTAMAAMGVAVFFLRFWRQTGDRLFLLMSLGFVLMCANLTLLAIVNPRHESRHLLYLFRLGGFLLLIIAIIDKNRAKP